ncbi:polysialyltransferase family glycosyltransferase [Streptomyces sp. TRM 70361]|uniref:polysialyltransferase family glycosyltransferase n=1 Tax=Streptomyces sp. TRM 70361 TaxID=3116553 RepID=UPI002E7AF478|nr:polysialyltransferase family glycosyltransferase [Streptomyces sp. TRM 70361]MEE1938529.1 polysialyltransferase family glycosyltransferase [Streptomyces sp. TRM 70361]
MPDTTDTPGATAGGRTPVQLFEVSTLYGAATLAAALDAGLFGPRHRALRVLLVSNNAEVPETASRLDGMRGWHRIAARFDRVVDWNDTIRPHHPGTWAPAADDAPLWERLFRANWELGDGPVDLVVESVHVSPAKALAAVFASASVHVYADGLMSYGPTREKLPQTTACRIRRLLHLDLVPGLRPLLLTEYGVPAELVPNEVFRAVLDELDEPAPEDGPDAVPAAGTENAPTAVLLGQYLAALGILTVAEEEALHERMLRGAAAAGHRSVLFKPHPTAPVSYSRTLDKAAADAGVRLIVLDRPMLAETVFRRCRPRLVVGCFSTAMLTASALYGVPVARVGTEPLLDRLAPYQNSNRVPLTVVDALVPDLETERRGEVVTDSAAAVRRIGPLVRAVGYCMQAERYPGLRAGAEEWLTVHLGEDTARYFKRRRLTALGLPGGLTPGLVRRLPGSGTALRAARRVRRAAAARARADRGS